MTEAVIGWVDGAPVPSSALAPYMAGVAARPAGARLGVTTEPDALVGPAHSRADGLRTWGTKALLVETLLKAEAARLGVNEAASPSDWLARLEANGELAGPAPTEAEVEAYHAATLGSLAAGASRDRASRDRGGDLGWVERGQLAGPLEDAIFGAEPGRVTGPVRSAFGWHLVVVEDVRPARDRTLTECRSEIRAELTEYRRRRAWLDWLDRRVAEAITVPAGEEHPLFRGLPGSTHRH